MARPLAHAREGQIVVPACGHRFIDQPRRDLRPIGALACIGSATIVVSALVAILRFVQVL